MLTQESRAATDSRGVDELTRWLDEVVYPRLSHEAVFGSLPGFRRAGPGRYVALCPDHDDHHPSLSMRDGFFAARCFACGSTISWYSWVERQAGPGRATIEALARMAGVPPLAASPEAERRFAAARKAEDEREAFLAAARAALWRPEGADVLRYLRDGRGYDDETIREAGLGTWPPQADPDPARRLGLGYPSAGKAHRLVLPLRDAAGRLVGFALRAVGPVEGGPKYLYSRGLDRKRLLIGLHLARRAGEPPILAEGVLDALVLGARGLPVVGIGGSRLAWEQVEALRAAGVRSVVLAPDADEAGLAGAEASARLLLQAGVRAYVIDPAGYGGAKDPDELARRPGGIDRLRELARAAKAAPAWLVGRIMAADDLSTDRGRDAALFAALDLADSLPDPVLRDQAAEAIHEALPLSEEALAEALERREAARAAEEQARARREAARKLAEAAQRVAAGDETDAVADLAEALRTWEAARARPRTGAAEDAGVVDVAGVAAELAAWTDGLETPWPLATAAGVRLDAGQLTVFAAPTSAGKSALAANLALHLLRAAEDGVVVWWSSELLREQIVARLVGMLATEAVLAGGGKDEIGMWDVIADERRGRRRPEVHQAWQALAGLAPRLRLLDDGALSALELAGYVARLAESGRRVTAVVADHLQDLMPVPPDHELAPRYSRSREEEVAATAITLRRLAQGVVDGRRVDGLRIPVVATAQVNRNIHYDSDDYTPRLEYIRDSGRVEQSASLVLGVRNSTMAHDEAPVAGGAVVTGQDALYRDAPDEALRAARAGALAAVRQQYGEQASLLEAYTLKNRLRGRVGLVVPLALLGRSGLVLPLDWRYAAEGAAGAAPSGAGGLRKRGGRAAAKVVSLPVVETPEQDLF